MNRWLLSAAFLLAIPQFGIITPASAATEVSVENVGAVLNESLALPANDAPGSGISFQEFFEFSLPVGETVTLSMSDSAVGTEKVIGGVFEVNHFTSTGPGPLFIPFGSLIDSTGLSNTAGGQTATLGPNSLSAGDYFAELSGVSGNSPIHIAIDGTVTAAASVPEPATWVSLLLGFAAIGWVTRNARRVA